jgi:hypothetical protein
VLELDALSVESQSCVDLLHLIQVDDSLALSTGRVGEVFEEELTGQFTLFQCEPSLAPSLRNKRRVSGADRIENFTANQ